jgi:nicotinate-nucleotide adenylyltransferase
MRIGVLGGTFDPPHMGHLILAEQARDQASLDRILWVPASDPPHKQGIVISPVEHRVEMVKCAIEDNPTFDLSRVDVDRPGPHFTVDMLRLLKQQYPNSELHFLIGGDSLRDLPIWHQPELIIREASLVVMTRPNAACDLDSLEHQIPGIRDRLSFLETPLIDISGRIIRKQVQVNQSIRYLVADRVRDYILLHRLYHDLPLE